jgi:hypothetical protein
MHPFVSSPIVLFCLCILIALIDTRNYRLNASTYNGYAVQSLSCQLMYLIGEIWTTGTTRRLKTRGRLM